MSKLPQLNHQVTRYTRNHSRCSISVGIKTNLSKALTFNNDRSRQLRP